MSLISAIHARRRLRDRAPSVSLHAWRQSKLNTGRTGTIPAAPDHEQARQERSAAPHRREPQGALRLFHRGALRGRARARRAGKSSPCAPARRRSPRLRLSARTAKPSCSARTSRRSTPPRRMSWPIPCARASYCSTSRELSRLVGSVERKGYTLVPLDLHWKDGRAKARGRPRQGQEAARQARHRKRSRLAARQGANAETRLSHQPGSRYMKNAIAPSSGAVVHVAVSAISQPHHHRSRPMGKSKPSRGSRSIPPARTWPGQRTTASKPRSPYSRSLAQDRAQLQGRIGIQGTRGRLGQ